MASFAEIALLRSFDRHTLDLINASHERQNLCIMKYHTQQALPKLAQCVVTVHGY